MKEHILIIAFLTQFVVIIECRNVRKEEPPDDYCGDIYVGHWSDKCSEGGGGYGAWRCTTIDYENDIYKWVKQKTITCPKEKSGCQCFEVGDWDDIECECYNPTSPPTFPPVGIIRWSGSEYYDASYYIHRERPRTLQVFGEVHKNGNGHFLLNRTVVGKWDYFDHDQIPDVRILFEIYVSDGSGFMKYTGEHGNKICSKSHVAQTKELSSIWNSGVYRGRSYRLKENTWKEGSIYTQKWERFEHGSEHDFRWTMDVEYDSEKKYAIPIRYKNREHDGFNGELLVRKNEYKYESINEDEESFRLEDFCDGV